MTYPTQKSGPSKVGYVVGIVLLVIGIGGGITAIVVGALTAVNRVDDYQRVPVGAQNRTISFSKAGRYNAYYERPGIHRRSEIPSIQIQLQGPDGRLVLTSDLLRTSTNEHYDLDDHEGVRITGFTVSKPGDYKVLFGGESTRAGSDQIAFGKGSVGILLGGVLGGLFGGGFVALIGLVVLISTGVRRRNYRKRMAYAGYGPPAAYGTPGGYGPPGGYAPPPGAWPPAAAPPAPGAWPQAPDHRPPGQPEPPPGWVPPPTQPAPPPASAPPPPPMQPPPPPGPGTDPEPLG